MNLVPFMLAVGASVSLLGGIIQAIIALIELNKHSVRSGQQRMWSVVILIFIILTVIFGRAFYISISTNPSGPSSTPLVTKIPTATVHPTPTDTPTPTTPGLILSYTLNFGDRTAVDLDTGHAHLNGNANDELGLDFGRFYFGASENTWAKTQVVYINDSQASYKGCADGTLIQQDPAFLNNVEQDQTICVATSKGNWATMKIKDVKSSASGLGAGDITFDVKLFHP